MQVLYAMPFVLVSVLAFLACVIVPRWRRYKFQALVAPVAFGFCSIVAAALIVLYIRPLQSGLIHETVDRAMGRSATALDLRRPRSTGQLGCCSHRCKNRPSS